MRTAAFSSSLQISCSHYLIFNLLDLLICFYKAFYRKRRSLLLQPAFSIIKPSKLTIKLYIDRGIVFYQFPQLLSIMFFILYHLIDILLLLLIIPNLQFAKRAIHSDTFIQRLQSLLISAFFFTKSNIIHARCCILPVLSAKRFAFARFSAFLNCSINHWNISRFPLSSICDKSSTQNFEISSANILAPPAESSISTEYIKKTLSLYPILLTAALIYPFSYTNLLDFLHDM